MTGPFVAIALGLLLVLGLAARDGASAQFKEAAKRSISPGEKAEIKSVIATGDGETFVLRDLLPNDTVARLTDLNPTTAPILLRVLGTDEILKGEPKRVRRTAPPIGSRTIRASERTRADRTPGRPLDGRQPPPE